MPWFLLRRHRTPNATDARLGLEELEAHAAPVGLLLQDFLPAILVSPVAPPEPDVPVLMGSTTATDGVAALPPWDLSAAASVPDDAYSGPSESATLTAADVGGDGYPAADPIDPLDPAFGAARDGGDFINPLTGEGANAAVGGGGGVGSGGGGGTNSGSSPGSVGPLGSGPGAGVLPAAGTVGAASGATGGPAGAASGSAAGSGSFANELNDGQLQAQTLQEFGAPPTDTLANQSAGTFQGLLGGTQSVAHAGQVAGGAFSAGSFTGAATATTNGTPGTPGSSGGQLGQLETLTGAVNQYPAQIHTAPFTDSFERPGESGGGSGTAAGTAGLLAAPGAGPRSPAAAPTAGTDPLTETGTVTETVTGAGSNASTSFTLRETVTITALSLYEDGASFTLTESGTVSFTYQEVTGGTTTTQTGTTAISVSATDATAASPDDAGFDVDAFNQTQFGSAASWATQNETITGSDSLSISDTGVSTFDDGTSYNYTVTDSASDSFTDDETDAGTSETDDDDDTGSDQMGVTESGTNTLADGTVVTFRVTDQSADSFTDDDDGPTVGTDTVTDDETGSDSISVVESGTSSDGAGNTVNFTVTDATSDTFTDDESGPEDATTGAGTDTFSVGTSGTDSLSLSETGAVAESGLVATFTASDQSNDGFTDQDTGTASDATDGVDTFNDQVSGSDTDSVVETGSSTDSSGSALAVTLTDTSTDSFSSSDAGADTETGGADSGTDDFSDSDGGAETASLHEAGTSVINGITFQLTLDDQTTDGETDGDSGTDDLATGDEDENYTDSATGSDQLTEQVGATIPGASVAAGSSGSVVLALTDTSGDSFSDADSGTDDLVETDGTANETVTDTFDDSDGGTDSFSVTAVATGLAFGSGVIGFNLTDQTGDTFTDTDTGTEVDNGSTESETDDYTDGTTGTDTIVQAESGTTTASAGVPVTFSVADTTGDSFTDTDEGTETDPATGTVTGSEEDEQEDAGTDSLSVGELGTSSDTAGDSLSFTITDDTQDSFTADDQETQTSGSAASNDRFSADASGADTFTAVESGVQNASGFAFNFRVNDAAADDFSEDDSGTLNLPSSGAATSGADAVTLDVSGSDTLSVSEAGASGTAPGPQTWATVTDAAADSFTDDSTGTDTEATGTDVPVLSCFTDDVTGTDTVGLTETGATSGGGGTTGSFSLTDTALECYTDDDDSDAGGGDTDTVVAHGSDTFGVTQNTSTSSSGGGSTSLSATASSTGCFTDDDTEVDDPSATSSQVSLSVSDTGSNVSDNKVTVPATGSGGSATSSDDYNSDYFTVTGSEATGGGVTTYTADSKDTGLESYTLNVASAGSTSSSIDSATDCYSIDDQSTSAGGTGTGGVLVLTGETVSRTDQGLKVTQSGPASTAPPTAPASRAFEPDAVSSTSASAAMPWTSTSDNFRVTLSSVSNTGGTSGTTTSYDNVANSFSFSTSGGGTSSFYTAQVTTTIQNGVTLPATGPYTRTVWSGSSTTVTSGDVSDPPPAPPPAPPPPSWFSQLAAGNVATALVSGLDTVTGGLSTSALSSQTFGTVLDGTDQFFAGASSALTAGATDRMRAQMYGETATKNHQGALYSAGQVVGTGLGVAVGFANPCAIGGVVGAGVRGINLLQAAGNGINAVENYQKGDMLSAAGDALGVLGNVATFLKACFAAGTPIRTPDGWKRIEELKEGDSVLARDEHDPDGPVLPKVVEELFVTTAPVLNLRVAGQVITTTGEHPFFAQGRGWVGANQLSPGERVLGQSGEWLPVEGLHDAGLVTTVYNFRVADFHTYFVGADEWGFAVWVHNTTTCIGRNKDLEQFANNPEVDTWLKSGRIPKPGERPVTWKENEQWIFERFQRGDTFAIATDPSTLPKVVNGFIPGTPNGYFTARELKFLTEELGLELGKDIKLWHIPHGL